MKSSRQPRIQGTIRTAKKSTTSAKVKGADGEDQIDVEVCGLCTHFNLKYPEIDGGYCKVQRKVKNALEVCNKYVMKERR